MIIVNEMESVGPLDKNLNGTLDYGALASIHCITASTGSKTGTRLVSAANTKGHEGYFFRPSTYKTMKYKTIQHLSKKNEIIDEINLVRVEIFFPNGNVADRYRISPANSGEIH